MTKTIQDAVKELRSALKVKGLKFRLHILSLRVSSAPACRVETPTYEARFTDEEQHLFLHELASRGFTEAYKTPIDTDRMTHGRGGFFEYHG